jgi:hypothetical protein
MARVAGVMGFFHEPEVLLSGRGGWEAGLPVRKGVCVPGQMILPVREHTFLKPFRYPAFTFLAGP